MALDKSEIPDDMEVISIWAGEGITHAGRKVSGRWVPICGTRRRRAFYGKSRFRFIACTKCERKLKKDANTKTS